MHVPDHLINNGTEMVAGFSAAAVLCAAVTGRHLPGVAEADGEAAPTLLAHPERFGSQLATAALIFALQMVNFPVLPGTSGHLLGGALATVLVGPRRALLATASVVTAQALVFADGGIAALGVNLWLIAILPVAVAVAVERSLAAITRGGHAPIWARAGLAALLAPPLASIAFSTMYATGAAGDASIGAVTTSMLAVHVAIGVGEAALTLAVLVLVERTGNRRDETDTAPVWGAAVVGAACLSLVASSQPDGLERVAGELGFSVAGPDSIVHASPLAGYTISGVQGWASGSAAGVIGLAMTCLICAGFATLAHPASVRSSRL